MYGFFFPVVYILIDFLASRISSSSSFHKKGTQVLDILSYCLLKNVYLLLLYFLFEGILVEYFPFRTFELSVYCFWALIVLLCINLNSAFFFFYWDAGLIFLFNHCVLNCNSQMEKSTTHRTSTYVSLTQGKREHCQHSTVSSWDLQNFHKTSGFSWRAYLRVSLAFPRSYGMTFFSTLFTFHCCSAHF